MSIKEYKKIIDDKLIKSYPDGPKLLKGPINHVLYGGKRIRPLLCMLVNEACGGKLEDSIDVSMSIELLHIFSLVHDDIMDGDNLRHGVETIHEKWNNSVAILAGDAILALAIKKLNSSSNLVKEKFNNALIAVCEGQALDVEYENLNTISIEQYFKMVNLKTSYMLGLSMEMGSLIANVDIDTVNKFRQIGLLIGKVFQIQDDLLEITSDTKTMGKSLSSDILLNKKTYLMIQLDIKHPGVLDDIYKSCNGDADLLKKQIKKVLMESGIIDETRKYIECVFDDIYSIISSIPTSNDNVIELIDFIKNRKK
tara:strand:+ start:290 stop:1222 length:933 start_codon:yes stop_codon:yes gene_type:complete